jgi:hypothetical protein
LPRVRRVAEPLNVLIAARDEEDSIGAAVGRLRQAFPEAEVIVADDGSRDRTADVAEEAGATVLRLPPRGKGQALTLAERAALPGRLVLCDADLRGDLRPLAEAGADLAVAAFSERQGGGFGIAKRAGALLIRMRAGFESCEPLSGQRVLSARARAACFPLAAGFGCEVGGTIDAVRAGCSVREVELPLEHRPTGRDLAGFAHRARQLVDALLACGPQGINHRGLRLPLVGALGALAGLRAPRRLGTAVAAVALIGLADDLWSGPERGVRAHVRAGRTTGVLKLVGIPLVGLAATRRLSGALGVGLAANALNQLDTRPGRALKAFLLSAPRRSPYLAAAVLLLPYDLREQAMLGDAGSNALGAVLGLSSVVELTPRARWAVIAGLVGLNALGERRSLGALIERTPVLAQIDAWGRQP